MDTPEFQSFIYTFYHDQKRSFPWRETCDPYKILVSEVMLQQTQTSRVQEKYDQWMKTFPNVSTLASSSLKEVLTLWQGLGYNRRGKYLYHAAQMIMDDFEGIVPNQVKLLETLPGVGEYTARAVAIFAFNQPHVLIETNIRSVYIHHFFEDQATVHDKAVKAEIEKTMDTENPREWYYALMDYGSHLKKTLNHNPSRKSKHYTKQSKFHGSTRQLRGAILRHLTHNDSATRSALYQEFPNNKDRVDMILRDLRNEGFIQEISKKFIITE